jgi:hypothetical protein
MASSSSRLGAVVERRRGNVAILDGGMGTGLAALGLSEQQAWTAGECLGDERIRTAVSRVYDAYLRAGADILTVNTYNISAQKYLNRAAVVARRAQQQRQTGTSSGAASLMPVMTLALHEQGSAESNAPLSTEAALAKESAHLIENVALAREAVATHARNNPTAPPPLLAASMGGFATAILR